MEFFVIQIRVYPGGSHSMRPSTSGSYRSYSTSERTPWRGLARPPTSFSAGLSWHQGVDARAEPGQGVGYRKIQRKTGNYVANSGKRVAAAGFRIGGEPTPLRGDLAHRVTEAGIVRPERFSHTLARVCMCSALFRRHGHDRASLSRERQVSGMYGIALF